MKVLRTDNEEETGIDQEPGKENVAPVNDNVETMDTENSQKSAGVGVKIPAKKISEKRNFQDPSILKKPDKYVGVTMVTLEHSSFPGSYH